MKIFNICYLYFVKLVNLQVQDTIDKCFCDKLLCEEGSFKSMWFI